ncbi:MULTISPECIES: 30S ribosomal protein S18 [Salegentibacter]|jgi:small subunit ribosomal protein S18|uniref:Small ribosomal subunit protein bS18 n=3 Tax=Salegentibacter TaxID=143222 RepID=A0A0Q9ZJG7_9FLAO|nr:MULTISPECIES: 30S ribosomal protein S18 [Salegentibacter]HKL35782.1 30S ribosomal protein S18 [Salegentibacter sp.]KRG29786.1 30S ribosomal protein S18 [Salegentibacter mishustinae]MDX1427333.1 30S ribosomal protein S18 [Salegentibacter mishustinae]MDX1720148.1 30S ribosomal protein S18 [Salegentibacter mishustinae]OEY73582.1 30S ribosomal protein S18 [Salegentibacter salarius]|tara:strand:+ start:330 stop:629 length:300 start_codon:yes stop_codon:yes gene_type:complete
MATSIEQQAKGKKDGEIRYLTPLNIETSKTKKYCRFKRSGIKYVDYKDPDWLMSFVNEQGKLLPRRLTGTSLKYQRKVAVAVKRARHLALMPYVGDLLK